MQPKIDSVDGQGPAAKARQALQAVEGVGEDLTGATKKIFVGVIRGAQDVTAAFGNAVLENTRQTVQGVALVGSEMGALAKGAALGLIYGAAEVGSELGTVCKKGTVSAIQGAGEVALSLEEVVMGTARALLRDVGKLRYVVPVEAIEGQPAETAVATAAEPSVPVTNILSVAPVVVATAAPKRSKKV